jgi:hypothetical protein
MTILPFTVWYAPGDDSHIIERVQVLGTAYFPAWGRYVLFKQIDWPDTGQPYPSCTHEKTFLALYTPQETEPCLQSLPGNSFSKTSWRAQLSSFFQRLRLWRNPATRATKPW